MKKRGRLIFMLAGCLLLGGLVAKSGLDHEEAALMESLPAEVWIEASDNGGEYIVLESEQESEQELQSESEQEAAVPEVLQTSESEQVFVEAETTETVEAMSEVEELSQEVMQPVTEQPVSEPQSEELQPEVAQPEESQPEESKQEEPQQEEVQQESQTKETQLTAHTCIFHEEHTAPTCLKEGMSRQICNGCGAVASQQELSALGHDFKMSIWESPTCQQGGYYNNICQRCGLVECVVQEALPHEVEDVTIREGNCMEDTVIRHLCKNCGQQIKSDTRFTPEIHEWTTGVVDGKEVTYCLNCGVAK